MESLIKSAIPLKRVPSQKLDGSKYLRYTTHTQQNACVVKTYRPIDRTPKSKPVLRLPKFKRVSESFMYFLFL